jgi:hypothetical protein
MKKKRMSKAAKLQRRKLWDEGARVYRAGVSETTRWICDAPTMEISAQRCLAIAHAMKMMNGRRARAYRLTQQLFSE